MDTVQAIKQRRAVKAFDPTHTMPKADMDALFGSAMLSPTSFNIQNWRFVNVTDPELRQQIRAAAWNQAQITEASMLVVICADLMAWDKSPERYWKLAPQAVQDYLVPMIRPFYEGQPQLQRDEAMRSVGIAAQTLMLTAKALGYDSCPMIGFDQAAVAEIIRLPKDHVIGMIVTIGKALKPANPRSGPVDASDVIIENTFA